MVDFSSLKKRFPSRRKIFYSFIVCLGMCLGFLSQNASAASVYSFNGTVQWDGQTKTFSSGQTSFVVAAGLSRVNTTATWRGATFSSDWAGWNNILVTGSFLVNMNYTASPTTRPVEISCPVLDTRFVTQDCQLDVVESTYANSHYYLYNFVIQGVVNSTANASQLALSFNLKNFSDTDANLWFMPLEVTLGPDEFARLVQIKTNTDSIITYLSAIDNRSGVTQGLMRDIQSSMADLLTAIQNSSTAGVVAQQQITNQKLDSLQQSIEEQSEQEQNQYEQEKEEESEREAQIQSDADDSQISAQVTGNPFTALFSSNECVTLTTISGWFNASPAIQVCSPYPANIRPILLFVTSALMVGLLIRLYYKRLNGGYNG